MQIPDNIRPTVDIIVKHHFWMLAALVPLIVVPVAWIATSDLAQKIKAKQGEIDSKLSSVRSVQSTAEHPNENWAETLKRDTAQVKRDTFAEWQRFYDEQAPIRVWPESLGPDFVERASRLQPGGRLTRSLLERYQDGVKNIVRTLPKRMGADEAMRDVNAGDEGSARSRPALPVKPRVGPQPLVRWNAADQKRLYDSFDWAKPPTTVQVQLAQEEIWMYQILCDAVAAMNARSAGAYDSVVPLVEELAVGFPAAEDKPGGAGEGRVLRAKSTGPAGMAMEPAPEDGGGEAGGAASATLTRPAHPRFAGVGGGGFEPPAGAGAPGADGGEGVPASPDDKYRNWVYVDFNGRPLMASEQTATLANRMIHMIPFRLRVVIDQRRIDELMQKLAGSPIPVDVRQVRINPGAAGPGSSGVPMDFSGGQPGPDGGSGGRRPYDVMVELRGTMAVAAFPDRKVLLGDASLEEPAQPSETPGEEEGGAPQEQDAPAAADPAPTESVPAESVPGESAPADAAPVPENPPPAEENAPPAAVPPAAVSPAAVSPVALSRVEAVA